MIRRRNPPALERARPKLCGWKCGAATFPFGVWKHMQQRFLVTIIGGKTRAAHKVVNQLNELGAKVIQHSGQSVSFVMAIHNVARCKELCGVACLYACVFEQKSSPIFENPPKWSVLDAWFEAADISTAIGAWAVLHGGAAPPSVAFRSLRHSSKSGRSRQSSEHHHALVSRARACLERRPGLRLFDNSPFMIELSLVEGSARACVPLMRHHEVVSASVVHQGLHHTVSYGLARLANLRSADVVLDVCCGTASLVVEAREHYPGCGAFLGIDCDVSQLARASDNVAAHQHSRPHGASVALLAADCAALPLRTGTIDAVVSDLPFGRQHGATESSEGQCFSRLMREIGRVLSPRGRAVLLCASATATPLMSATEHAAARLVMHAALPTRLCNISCVAVLLVPASTSRDEAESRFDMGGCEREDGAFSWLSWRQPSPLVPIEVF